MSRVSVVMPVYNGAAFLQEAMASILNQSYTDFEFLIINDGSTDSSRTVIQQFNDTRIRYIENSTNKGLVATLNIGLNLATGQYIARMDQDDVAVPERFQKQFEFMESHPEYGMCGTVIDFIGPRTTRHFAMTDEEIKVELIFGCPFSHPTVMIRRSALADNKLQYDEQYKHAEDYGLWMELAPYGKMANLPYKGLKYRLHEKQYSQTFKTEMAASCTLIRKRYLAQLHITMADDDLALFETLMDRDASFEDAALVKQLGKFLQRLPGYFIKKPVDDQLLKNYIYKKWKVILANRQTRGHNSYLLFLGNRLSWLKFEPKVHLWFIKKVLGF